MDIRKAEVKDYALVQHFYWTICKRMEGTKYDALWRVGIYPSDELLLSAIERQELLLLEEDGIAGAMILNHECNEGYSHCRWQVEAEAAEVLFIHALGVHPDLQGRGLAKLLVSRAVREAEEQGLKAVRLDVVPANRPAVRLYESFGFSFTGSMNMYYEDTGWMDFHLYELVIGERK